MFLIKFEMTKLFGWQSLVMQTKRCILLMLEIFVLVINVFCCCRNGVKNSQDCDVGAIDFYLFLSDVLYCIFRYIICNALHALYSMHCILCIVFFAFIVCIVFYAWQFIYCILYFVYSKCLILRIVLFALYSMHYSLCRQKCSKIY